MLCINLYLPPADPRSHFLAPGTGRCRIQLVHGLQSIAVIVKDIHGNLLQKSIPKPPFEVLGGQRGGFVHAAPVPRGLQQLFQHLRIKHQVSVQHQQVTALDGFLRKMHGINIVGFPVQGILHQDDVQAGALRLLPDLFGICAGGDDRLADAAGSQQPQLPGQNGFSPGQGQQAFGLIFG